MMRILLTTITLLFVTVSTLLAVRLPFRPILKNRVLKIIGASRGDHCGIAREGWKIFKRSGKKYRQFWRKFNSHRSKPLPLPGFDFHKYTLIAYNFGERLFQGDQIKIEDLRIRDGVLTLIYKKTVADWKNATGYQLSSPYLFLKVEKAPFKGYDFKEIVEPIVFQEVIKATQPPTSASQ